jgi:hypothetical protein
LSRWGGQPQLHKCAKIMQRERRGGGLCACGGVWVWGFWLSWPLMVRWGL